MSPGVSCNIQYISFCHSRTWRTYDMSLFAFAVEKYLVINHAFIGWRRGVLWVRIWPMFYFRNFCCGCNIVLYWTAIYREFLLPHVQWYTRQMPGLMSVTGLVTDMFLAVFYMGLLHSLDPFDLFWNLFEFLKSEYQWLYELALILRLLP